MPRLSQKIRLQKARSRCYPLRCIAAQHSRRYVQRTFEPVISVLTGEKNMRHRIDLGNWKSIIGTTVLAAGLTLFAGAGITKADDCQGRIVRADHHLHEAIEHHGYESRQAVHARTELHNA